jgi:hypothetical protein
MMISADALEDIKDQADQIMYFEASMPNIDNATNMLVERLSAIYMAGYDDANTDAEGKK